VQQVWLWLSVIHDERQIRELPDARSVHEGSKRAGRAGASAIARNLKELVLVK
jgi:hypothetical protein